MKLSTIAVFIALLISSLSLAQSKGNYNLKGAVVDSGTGKGLPGANIIILSRKDNHMITGTTADKRGFFSIDKIPVSIVKVKLSMMGYQTKLIDSLSLENTSQIGIIRLKAGSIELPEVVVKSIKPMIEFKVDKQVINMDQVPGSTGSVTDALKNTGIVDVDPQTNNISVRGQSVKLEMDGHPFEMPANMLAQMPASMVNQVEVILSPGAKESAEGGAYILNIITKKTKFKNFNGSISLNSSTNKRNYGGINFNYKINKINLFTSFFGGYGEYSNLGNADKLNYNSPDYHNILSYSENKMNAYSGYFKIGIDYDLDKYNSFTFYGTLNKFKYNSNGSNLSSVENQYMVEQYNYSNNQNSEFQWNNYSLYGFYKRKFQKKDEELTFDAYVTNIGNPSTSKLNTGYSYMLASPQLHNSYTDQKATTVIFKTNYIYPSDIGKFETGYNFSYRNRTENYNALDFSYIYNNWLDSLNLSNLFEYKENIHAAYLTYSNNFGKFGIKGGVRVEDLISHGKQVTTNESFSENYLNFFPNLNLSYKLSSLFQLTLNMYRRVRYPPMYFLNPFKQYNGPNSYTQGNPVIKPYFINSYAINLSQYISVYYVFSTGLFDYAMTTVQDSITFNSPINLSSNKTYGFELTLPYYNSPAMPFHLPGFISMFNAKFGYNYRKRVGSYLNEDMSDWGYYKWFNVTLGLRLWYDINANVSFRYTPETKSKRYIKNQTTNLSLYLSKNLLSRKLKISLYISDLLNTNDYSRQTFGTDFYYSSNFSIRNSRSIMLGITYMINNYKPRNDKKIDDSRDASNKEL